MVSTTPLLAQMQQQPIVLTSTRSRSRDRVIFSQNICINIFAFLPNPSLAASSCVHRSWRVLVNEKNWPMKYSQDIRSDFNLLVNERLLDWEGTDLSALLSRFVDGVMGREKSCDSIVREKNPELGIKSFYSYMPRPVVQCGDYDFFICNLTDIEMNKKGNPHPILIRGEVEKNISHLAVEGHFLFALRSDGIIIQINYETQEEIQRIETAYYRENKEYRRSIKGSVEIEHAFCNEFYIKDGYIIIVYLWSANSTRCLEIIPYRDKDSRKAQLIEDLSLDSEKFALENHQMMMGKNSIEVRNLSTSETSTYPVKVGYEGGLLDVDLERHILYVLDRDCRIHRINLKTKKVSPKSHILTHPIQQCVVIRDLLFGFSFSRRQIHVIDIHSKKASVVGVLPLNINDPECQCKLLKQLSAIVESVLQARKIQSDSHSKCVIS